MSSTTWSRNRSYRWVITLCAIYASIVLVQGRTKLALNVYRGWVGERALRDLRRRIHSVVEAPPASSPAAEAQGIAISMIVAEVEPIGGFVGESVSEPVLQAGIILSVLAYLIYLEWSMALTAFALFVPQFLFVPLLQAAVNWRAGARVQLLRQLGVGVIDRNNGRGRADDQRIALPAQASLRVREPIERPICGRERASSRSYPAACGGVLRRRRPGPGG